MSDLLAKLKMAALQMILPTVVSLGKEELKEAMKKIALTAPKKFNLLVQGLYPPIKGLLVPFVHSTKTTLDDAVADPFCEAIEEVAAELNISLPTVVPVDFSTPDEEEAATV